MSTIVNALLARYWGNDEGAALVEYGLLVGLISIVCLVAITALGTNVNGVFDAISTKLAAAL